MDVGHGGLFHVVLAQPGVVTLWALSSRHNGLIYVFFYVSLVQCRYGPRDVSVLLSHDWVASLYKMLNSTQLVIVIGQHLHSPPSCGTIYHFFY